MTNAAKWKEFLKWCESHDVKDFEKFTVEEIVNKVEELQKGDNAKQ